MENTNPVTTPETAPADWREAILALCAAVCHLNGLEPGSQEADAAAVQAIRAAIA